MVMVELLKEQRDSIDVQKLAVDVLKCLMADGAPSEDFFICICCSPFKGGQTVNCGVYSAV